MIEEIIEIDNRQYKLNLETPLSSEQKWQTAEEIRRQLQLGVPIENIVISLAPAQCPVNNKRYVGQTVMLTDTPSGGNGNFTVVFKKDPGTGSEVTLPTSGGPSTFNSSYTFQPADVSITAHIFRETVTEV